MTDLLTRDQMLNMSDLDVKDLVLPEKIPGWGGQKVRIRQLTRAQQDTYLKRQWGQTRMKQDAKAKNQEISAVNLYGHDAFLVVCAVVDETGKPIFKETDIPNLEKKNGEAIGWIAREIVKFSKLDEDVEELAKNSSATQTDSSSSD